MVCSEVMGLIRFCLPLRTVGSLKVIWYFGEFIQATHEGLIPEKDEKLK